MHRTSAHRLSILAVVAVLVMLQGCSKPAPTPPPASAETPAQTESAAPVGLANPASENCIRQGGQLRIEKTPKGDEYGVCVFEDNHQCEEWALLRGECRAGGIRVTGYVTDAARFCAITGGTYTVTAGNDAATERGTCKPPGSKACDADAYFTGDCIRSP